MENVELFKQNSKNKHTTKATHSWVRTYQRWAEKNGQVLNLQEITDPVKLNGVLELFFANVKKLDGGEYEPCSLQALQAALDRHLKENGMKVDLYKDFEFSGSRDVLEGKAKYLRQKLNMGKYPNKASSITRTEEASLWTGGQLGTSDPRTLIHTMWWIFGMHFGVRTREEHYEMKIEDFVYKYDDENREYLTFSENATKTRQGGLRKKVRLVLPKMFATGGDNCPVALFREYIRRRPEELRESGPFYLSIIERPITEIWYKKSRLGVNYIASIMKRIKNDNFDLHDTKKRLTNHSNRKTLVKKLKSNHVPRCEIIGITGHTKESGLDPYDSGDEFEQRMYSDMINNVGPVVERSNTAITADKPSSSNKQFNLLSKEDGERLQAAASTSTSINEFTQASVPTFISNYKCNVDMSRKKSKKRKRRVIISSSESSQSQD